MHINGFLEKPTAQKLKNVGLLERKIFVLIDIENEGGKRDCLHLNYILKSTNQCHFLLNIQTYLTAIQVLCIDVVTYITIFKEIVCSVLGT